MKATVRAFDRESSGSFSETLTFESKKELDEQFNEFETRVPYRKWYYEMEVDGTPTAEEEKMLEDYEWA